MDCHRFSQLDRSITLQPYELQQHRSDRPLSDFQRRTEPRVSEDDRKFHFPDHDHASICKGGSGWYQSTQPIPFSAHHVQEYLRPESRPRPYSHPLQYHNINAPICLIPRSGQLIGLQFESLPLKSHESIWSQQKAFNRWYRAHDLGHKSCFDLEESLTIVSSSLIRAFINIYSFPKGKRGESDLEISWSGVFHVVIIMPFHEFERRCLHDGVFWRWDLDLDLTRYSSITKRSLQRHSHWPANTEKGESDTWSSGRAGRSTADHSRKVLNTNFGNFDAAITWGKIESETQEWCHRVIQIFKIFLLFPYSKLSWEGCSLTNCSTYHFCRGLSVWNKAFIWCWCGRPSSWSGMYDRELRTGQSKMYPVWWIWSQHQRWAEICYVDMLTLLQRCGQGFCSVFLLMNGNDMAVSYRLTVMLNLFMTEGIEEVTFDVEDGKLTCGRWWTSKNSSHSRGWHGHVHVHVYTRGLIIATARRFSEWTMLSLQCTI